MILALHGNMGSEADWRPVHTLCKEAFLTPDLWKYAEEGLSLEETAERICDLARALPSKPLLTGYSMGGRIALAAALREPNLWSRCVFLSTHPGLNTEEERAERRRHDEGWARRLLTWDQDRFWDAWNSQPTLRSDASEDRAEKLRLLVDKRLEMSAALSLWSLGRQPLKRRLPRATWVAGGSDVKFRELALSTAGKVELIPHAGHRLLSEAPQAVARILTQGTRNSFPE